MKRLFVLTVCLMLAAAMLPWSICAGNEGEEGECVVDVSWVGITSGPVCDVTVTLYKRQSTELIDDEYRRMWGGFRLVMTDADGNVLLDEPFDAPSKAIYLTEPGDYYCSVYDGNGYLQGIGNGTGGYTPFVQRLTVSEPYNPSPYEDMVASFVMSCELYPEDHDAAFREYLYVLHSAAAELEGEDWSLAACAEYMGPAMESYPDPEYAAYYEEFLSNEGYAVMEVTPLGVCDPMILTEEATFGFWSGECWNYLVLGLDIPFREDGTMLPYAEYTAEEPDGGVQTGGKKNTLGETGSHAETDGSAPDGQSEPVYVRILKICVIAGIGVCAVGAVTGAVIVLCRRKKH